MTFGSVNCKIGGEQSIKYHISCIQERKFHFHPVMHVSIALHNADVTYVSALLKTKSL